MPPPSEESYYTLCDPIKNIHLIHLIRRRQISNSIIRIHPQSHESNHTQPPTSSYQPPSLTPLYSYFITGDNDTSSTENMFSHTPEGDAAVLEYDLPNAQVLNSQMKTNWGRS